MAHGLDERPSRPIADASQAVAPATHRSSRGGDLEEVGLCARMATKDTETTGLIASVYGQLVSVSCLRPLLASHVDVWDLFARSRLARRHIPVRCDRLSSDTLSPWLATAGFLKEGPGTKPRVQEFHERGTGGLS